jgi:hypothetical protein
VEEFSGFRELCGVVIKQAASMCGRCFDRADIRAALGAAFGNSNRFGGKLEVSASEREASAAAPLAVPPPATASAAATGPTLTADVFNGGTAIVTSPSSADGTVVDSH